MLSPKNEGALVPRTLQENLRWRQRLLRFANTKERQEQVTALCSQDITYWINSFVFQYNPNAIGSGSLEVGPFITWDFQDEVIRMILECLETRRDLVIEKSREMGASWLCLLIMLWAFLFLDWKKFLMISRSAEAVDRPGDSDCLFWKLDFVIDRLPDWMLRCNRKKMRRKFGYRHPVTHSSITGQASTGKAGIGGRAWGMFIDEFSRIDEDNDVLQGTSDTTGCRIFNGTHFGLGTAFYDLTQRPDWKKIVLHWTSHPDKRRGLYTFHEGKIEILDKDYVFPPDYQFVMAESPTGGPHPGIRSPWYDDQCLRKPNKRAVAMDLDIDPSGSVSQFFDPLVIRVLQQQYAVTPRWTGDLMFDRDTGRPLELVPSPGGPLKLWCPLDGQNKPPLAKYGMGADIATGIGASPSCVAGFNQDTGEKVFEYTNAFIPAESLAPLCVALAWLFKSPEGDGARFCWEAAGPGVVFGKIVLSLGYRNVFFRTAEIGGLVKETSDSPGWWPTPNNVRITLEEYRSGLYSRQCLNRSKDALEECLAFKYGTSGQIEHANEHSGVDPAKARVNHADHVIADSLAWKMIRGKTTMAKKPEDRVPLLSLAWRRQLVEKEEQADEYWVR